MALGAARKPNSTPMQLTRLSLSRPHNQVNMLSQPHQLCLWSLRVCFESVSLKIEIYGLLVLLCQSSSTHSQGIPPLPPLSLTRRHLCLKLCRGCQNVLLYLSSEMRFGAKNQASFIFYRLNASVVLCVVIHVDSLTFL